MGVAAEDKPDAIQASGFFLSRTGRLQPADPLFRWFPVAAVRYSGVPQLQYRTVLGSMSTEVL